MFVIEHAGQLGNASEVCVVGSKVLMALGAFDPSIVNKWVLITNLIVLIYASPWVWRTLPVH